MDLFADWIATKHGMLGTMLAMIDAEQISHTETRGQLVDAIALIMRAGSAAGDIRPDANADDIATALLGIFTVAGSRTQHAQANRLLDLLIDSLRGPAVRTQ